MPAQGASKLKKFHIIQIGYDPVRHFRAVPVQDLIALRVLLLNGVVGCAVIRPQEYVNVVHSPLVDERSDRPPTHIIQPPADRGRARLDKSGTGGEKSSLP